jgi:hypothetical protein
MSAGETSKKTDKKVKTLKRDVRGLLLLQQYLQRKS